MDFSGIGHAFGCTGAGGSPFDLDDQEGYEKWRGEKLNFFPVAPETLMVKISDLASPRREERNAIIERCNTYNMAMYSADPETGKEDISALARLMGLKRYDQPLCTGPDGLTEITVVEGGRQGSYIPYSDKPLSWHTDGYYNKPDEQVRGFLLHCRRAAQEGGVSELLDPEIVYIRLRDENPDYIRALMRHDVLTIPANFEDGVMIRGAETGPVFSIISGKLHMRYTDRKRHIEWKDDALVLAARNKLTAVLTDPEEYIVRWKLQPGQGIVCNNVLHRRSGFRDYPDADPDEAVKGDRNRLLYRGRFLDRVSASL